MISTGEFSLNSWLKFAVASIAMLSKLKLNATETTELDRSIGQDLRRLSKTLCSKQHKTYIDATMRVFKFQGGKTLFVKLNKIISRRSFFFQTHLVLSIQVNRSFSVKFTGREKQQGCGSSYGTQSIFGTIFVNFSQENGDCL